MWDRAWRALSLSVNEWMKIRREVFPSVRFTSPDLHPLPSGYNSFSTSITPVSSIFPLRALPGVIFPCILAISRADTGPFLFNWDNSLSQIQNLPKFSTTSPGTKKGAPWGKQSPRRGLTLCPLFPGWSSFSSLSRSRLRGAAQVHFYPQAPQVLWCLARKKKFSSTKFKFQKIIKTIPVEFLIIGFSPSVLLFGCQKFVWRTCCSVSLCWMLIYFPGVSRGCWKTDHKCQDLILPAKKEHVLGSRSGRFP